MPRFGPFVTCSCWAKCDRSKLFTTLNVCSTLPSLSQKNESCRHYRHQPPHKLTRGKFSNDSERCSLAPRELTMSCSNQLYSAVKDRITLYFTMGRPFSPSKLPLPMGIWTPSSTWFLEPTRAHNPNGILIGSAVFAGLTTVTDRRRDRQTDHATRSVTIGRI